MMLSGKTACPDDPAWLNVNSGPEDDSGAGADGEPIDDVNTFDVGEE